MSFPQRVKNVIMYAVETATCRVIYAHFDALASRFLERHVTYLELVSHGAVWLLRYDFAFLSPRPQMPNMVLIGGVNCARPAPLPAVSQCNKYIMNTPITITTLVQKGGKSTQLLHVLVEQM